MKWIGVQCLQAVFFFSRIMKYKLINDIINVVLPPDGVPDVKWNKTPSPDSLGSFELLLDEELAASSGAQGGGGFGDGGSSGKGKSGKWK